MGRRVCSVRIVGHRLHCVECVEEQDMTLAQMTVSDFGAFCFAIFVSCSIANDVGQAIAAKQVAEACNKVGGFYYKDRVFECKEKKT